MFVHSALISSRVYVVRVSLCSLSGPPSCCVSLHPSVPTLLCYLVCFCFLHLIASKIKAEISSLIPFESSILGPLPACHTPYPVTKTGYKKNAGVNDPVIPNIHMPAACGTPTNSGIHWKAWVNKYTHYTFVFLNSAIKVWGLTLILSWASQKWCSPPLWRSAARPSGKRRPQGLSSYQRFTTQAGLKQGQTNTIISLCLHFTS